MSPLQYLPIQRQSYVNLSGNCKNRWWNKISIPDPPLVSTEDDFTSIPITDPTISASLLQIHCQSITNSLPIESQCSSNPLSIHVNTNPHWCQYTANPVSVSCQFRSTHLQCSTNPANLPIRLSNAYYIRPNREPIRRQTCANPVPIICQSRSIQCQYDPAPASIWWPSGSIHCQSSSISVPILGHGSNTNPVSILDNPPIQCQSRTYLPIPGQSTNPMPILYQPTIKILIRGQFANSIPSCPSITDQPIQYQSTNPLPICQ